MRTVLHALPVCMSFDRHRLKPYLETSLCIGARFNRGFLPLGKKKPRLSEANWSASGKKRHEAVALLYRKMS
jgi:hypothetical protein